MYMIELFLRDIQIYTIKARIFLLVDLLEFFSDLGSGDEKNK